MAPSREIKIGTDCSGMEAPIQAMRNLMLQYQHEFSCDFNPHVRATIAANFPHKVMYNDVTTRDNKKTPVVDVYVAGFPCQPFSSAGLQQGFSDSKGRGEIFFYVLDYIRTKKPKVFILENVSGLVRLEGGKYLQDILTELKSLGIYNIYHEILDTKNHGVPHSRRRWYCVGIETSSDDGNFSFPQAIPRASIELFLEKRDARLAATGMPPVSQGTATTNVKSALRQLVREGSDPTKEAFIVDCDSSPGRSKHIHGVSPCITCSRGAGHWVTNRGRRLMKEEMMRLQGMDPTRFTVAVTDSQLGKQLGNTMSVNVFERLLVRVLPAAKLVKRGVLVDRWESGEAIKKLASTRGCGFKAFSRPELKRKVSSPESAGSGSSSSPKRARK